MNFQQTQITIFCHFQLNEIPFRPNASFVHALGTNTDFRTRTFFVVQINKGKAPAEKL